MRCAQCRINHDRTCETLLRKFGISPVLVFFCELAVAVVWGETQLAHVPKGLDFVIGEEGIVDLLQLVEDELLLSLPIVSYHEEGPCAEELTYSSPIEPVQPEHDTSAQESAKDNPFQALAALKDKL